MEFFMLFLNVLAVLVVMYAAARGTWWLMEWASRHSLALPMGILIAALAIAGLISSNAK